MQGFNMGRYHAPASLDSALAPSSADSRPAKRARTSEPPTVRFEMPFAIWCSTCPSHSSSQLIGQGVRFNAQKKRVGNYFSSPIWSFRMKHTACGGWLEMRTDPQNADFVVVEGARKRDTGTDEEVAERTGGTVVAGLQGAVGLVEQRSEEEKRNNAFRVLEGKVEDKTAAKNAGARVEELRSVRERDWRDADERNRKLRDEFRVGRKARQKEDGVKEQVQERMGFGFELLDVSESDRRRAALVDFGGVKQDHAAARPLFDRVRNDEISNTRSKKTNKAQLLHQSLSRNTRASLDPFRVEDVFSDDRTSKPATLGIKRGIDPDKPVRRDKSVTMSSNSLVEYDSD